MHRFSGGLCRADLGDSMAFRGYNGGPGFDCQLQIVGFVNQHRIKMQQERE